MHQKTENFNISKQQLIELSKNPKVDVYSPDNIIKKINKSNLLKIQKLMRQHHQLNVAEFMRFFSYIFKDQIQKSDIFYLLYGLFKLYKQLTKNYKKSTISFSQISNHLNSKISVLNEECKIKQKILPLDLPISKNQKVNIIPPQINGKMLNERRFLNKLPYLFDKYLHTNRTIAQACYSFSHKYFMTIDSPTNFIRILDQKLNQVIKLQTQLQISKRQSIITYIAWSQYQARIAAILGNFSLSFWSLQDNFRYQVNIPSTIEGIKNPFVVIGYMQSSKIWYVIDNRPIIYILCPKNFQPIHQIKNFKMIKQKSSEKILTLQMKYQKLLCIGFQRKIFLVSLQTRQIITQIKNLKTSVTSFAFSQTYQTLFVSTYQIYFKAYQLTQYCDLTEKGRFQGHKHQIILLGTLQQKPVVYSLEQDQTLKIWDIRDFTCYQSFGVLKNINYIQIFPYHNGICLVGSKIYLYNWLNKKNNHITQQKIQNKQESLKIILLTTINKNIVVITNKDIKIFSYQNGSLIKIIKGIFTNQDIHFAFNNSQKKQLYIANQEGKFFILQCQNFTKINNFKLLPYPIYLNYSENQDLITLVGMGQIYICKNSQTQYMNLKRRIYNDVQKIIFCQISLLHDLIVLVYENINQQNNENNIFLYSFEKAKAIGKIKAQQLVQITIHPQKNCLVILQQKKLVIYQLQMKKSSITFLLRYENYLWSQNKLKQNYTKQFTQIIEKQDSKIISKKLILFDEKLVIISNLSCLMCKIDINFNEFRKIQLQINSNTYNPERIHSQNHNIAFSGKQLSQCIIMINNLNLLKQLYHKTRQFGKTIDCCKIGNIFGVLNQKFDYHFYNQQFQIIGLININMTLPIKWKIYSYDNNQLKDIDFVFNFIKNQEQNNHKYKNGQQTQLFNLTLVNKNQQNSQLDYSKKNIITLQKIIKNNLNSSNLSPIKLKSFSLRQRKLVIEKQRQQRQRLQYFLQQQMQSQNNKFISTNNLQTQNNINEVLGFFSVNHNQLIKNKGIQMKQLPQIKVLQKKLLNSIKDQNKSKKSIPTNSKIQKIILLNTPIKNKQTFNLDQTNRFNSFKIISNELNNNLINLANNNMSYNKSQKLIKKQLIQKIRIPSKSSHKNLIESLDKEIKKSKNYKDKIYKSSSLKSFKSQNLYKIEKKILN